MIDIQQIIKSNNTTKIQDWINSLDPSFLSDASINDLLFIAENLYAKTFDTKPLNLIFAQLTVELYDEICLIDTPSESGCFSSVNLRLRVLKECPKFEINDFFSPLVILNLIRSKFNAPLDEICDQATKWQTLEVDQLKKLRSFKNWLTVLEVLEENQNTKYPEFDNWKSIRHMLP